MSEQTVCPRCNGTKLEPKTVFECNMCNGSGVAPQSAEGEAAPDIDPAQISLCSSCGVMTKSTLSTQQCGKCGEYKGDLPWHTDSCGCRWALGRKDRLCDTHKALPSADSQASAETPDAQETDVKLTPQQVAQYEDMSGFKTTGDVHLKLSSKEAWEAIESLVEPQQPKTEELDDILLKVRFRIPNVTYEQRLHKTDPVHLEALEAIRQIIRTERVSELEALAAWAKLGSITKEKMREMAERRIAELKGKNQ